MSKNRVVYQVRRNDWDGKWGVFGSGLISSCHRKDNAQLFADKLNEQATEIKRLKAENGNLRREIEEAYSHWQES